MELQTFIYLAFVYLFIEYREIERMSEDTQQKSEFSTQLKTFRPFEGYG